MSHPRLALALAALLLGSAGAQGLPTVPPRPGWPPVPAPAVLPGGLLPVTDTVVRRARNGYTVLEVAAPSLYTQPVRVQGYQLDLLLRWQWPRVEAWAQAGYVITFSGASGAVTLPLRDVYGRGGVLAYGVSDGPWPDATVEGRRVPGAEIGYALVWPQGAGAARPQPWGLKFITVRPPRP